MVLRIFKMIATSSFLTALECTKFVFGRGTYSVPPGSLSGLRGPTYKGEGKEEGKGRDLDPPLKTAIADN